MLFAVDGRLFLSTPSARRATCLYLLQTAVSTISIHALREEGDAFTGTSFAGGKISIHALREEGDPCILFSAIPCSNFYPRPPRGGRLESVMLEQTDIDFYPRPPRGGRQQKQRQNLYFQTNYTTFCTNLEEP